MVMINVSFPTKTAYRPNVPAADPPGQLEDRSGEAPLGGRDGRHAIQGRYFHNQSEPYTCRRFSGARKAHHTNEPEIKQSMALSKINEILHHSG
jgi:hypothetical protein